MVDEDGAVGDEGIDFSGQAVGIIGEGVGSPGVADLVRLLFWPYCTKIAVTDGLNKPHPRNVLPLPLSRCIN